MICLHNVSSISIGTTLAVLFSMNAARAEDLAPVPHPTGEFNYQCGQGGHQAFVPADNGTILYMDCRNASTRFILDCASLGNTLGEYNDDILHLEDELKNPESEASGINLWNVTFDRDEIENKILPNLKIDREKIARILKHAESFLHAQPPTNPYRCELTN